MIVTSDKERGTRNAYTAFSFYVSHLIQIIIYSYVNDTIV